MISWVLGSILTCFVLVVIPYVFIGAASGYVLGQARGGMAGGSALWCAVLGPFGWILTLALTSDARKRVSEGDFSNLQEMIPKLPSRLGASGSATDGARASAGDDDEELMF